MWVQTSISVKSLENFRDFFECKTCECVYHKAKMKNTSHNPKCNRCYEKSRNRPKRKRKRNRTEKATCVRCGDQVVRYVMARHQRSNKCMRQYYGDKKSPYRCTCGKKLRTSHPSDVKSHASSNIHIMFLKKRNAKIAADRLRRRQMSSKQKTKYREDSRRRVLKMREAQTTIGKEKANHKNKVQKSMYKMY